MSYDDAKAVLSTRTPALCQADDCVTFAEFLFKMMKGGADVDKEIWISDMTLVFSRYARRDVEIMVKHPLDGIRATTMWLPTIPEVKSFLDGMAARRGRILANARRIVQAHDERVAEVELSPEQRAEIGKKMAAFAKEMHIRSLNVVEPVAGKEPVDIEALERRRQVRAELEARRAAKSEEELDAEARALKRFNEGRRA